MTSISQRLNNCFLAILLLLALDLGFVCQTSCKIKLIIRFFLFVEATCVSGYIIFGHILLYSNYRLILWSLTYVLEYILVVLVFNFSNNITFRDIYNDIMAVDYELHVDIKNAKKEELTLVVLHLAVFVSRLSLLIAYCLLRLDACLSNISGNMTFQILGLSVEIFLITHFFVLFAAYRRLKKLVDIVKSKKADVVRCLNIYKMIVNVTDSAKSVFDYAYLVPLLIRTVEVMISVFYPLTLINLKESVMAQKLSLIFILANLAVLNMLAMLFAPAFAAGLVSGVTEELKVVLYDILLMEKDAEYAWTIEKFIRYVEARPLKFRICKIVPLDWSLPVSVLNICVTYLIVMLQFSFNTSNN